MRSPDVVILLQDKHRFNRHAKLTLIESVTNINKPKEDLQEPLKRQENFWIRTLEALQLYGLNHELNSECLHPTFALFWLRFVNVLKCTLEGKPSFGRH